MVTKSTTECQLISSEGINNHKLLNFAENISKLTKSINHDFGYLIAKVSIITNCYNFCYLWTNGYHQTRGTDVNYLQRHKDSTQFGGNGRWTVVRPYRKKTNRNPQQFKIPLLVNHFAMPLEKFSDAKGAEGKATITTTAAKEKSGSHRVLILGDGQVRGCAW
jgi:hypothetical protein